MEYHKIFVRYNYGIHHDVQYLWRYFFSFPLLFCSSDHLVTYVLLNRLCVLVILIEINRMKLNLMIWES